jgi:hypothetical protein
MMSRKGILGVVVAAAMASATVLASVSFDPSTGTGFVGKGDVQTALGWNNAQAQANAGSLSFTYSEVVQQTVSCEKETHHSTMTRSGTRTGSVNDTLSYNARTHKQVDGFLLTGFTSQNDSWGSWSGDNNVNSCFSQGWTITADDLTVISGPALYVNGVALN